LPVHACAFVFCASLVTGFGGAEKGPGPLPL
jgi:hypothetical protein